MTEQEIARAIAQAVKEFATKLENRLDSVDTILHEDSEEEYLSFNGVLGLIDETLKEMGVEE